MSCSLDGTIFQPCKQILSAKMWEPSNSKYTCKVVNQCLKICNGLYRYWVRANIQYFQSIELPLFSGTLSVDRYSYNNHMGPKSPKSRPSEVWHCICTSNRVFCQQKTRIWSPSSGSAFRAEKMVLKQLWPIRIPDWCFQEIPMENQWGASSC